MTIAQSVIALLDRRECREPVTDDPGVDAAVEQVSALVKAYTRGRGFDGSEPNADLSAVIVTAAARLAANPSQIPNELPAGPGGATRALRGAFTGWSLAELAALNRYRVRAQ